MPGGAGATFGSPARRPRVRTADSSPVATGGASPTRSRARTGESTAAEDGKPGHHDL